MADSYTFKSESSLMPTGDYEVRLEEMGIAFLPSGKRKLAIRFRVRDDIDGQGYGNKCLFEDIWPEKENPNMFNRKRINQLLGTQDVKEGTVFNDIYAIMDFMRSNNCLVAHVITTFDEYKGEDVNKITYYKSSKHKPQVLGAKVATPTPKEPDDDEAFPFPL